MLSDQSELRVLSYIGAMKTAIFTALAGLALLKTASALKCYMVGAKSAMRHQLRTCGCN